jgi:hypothetical protein
MAARRSDMRDTSLYENRLNLVGGPAVKGSGAVTAYSRQTVTAYSRQTVAAYNRQAVATYSRQTVAAYLAAVT